MKAKKNQIYINNRTIATAHYMIDHMCTVRECAKHFGISKTCVHTNIVKRLPNISVNLYEDVKCLLAMNLEDRAYRGGEATKMKYHK